MALGPGVLRLGVTAILSGYWALLEGRAPVVLVGGGDSQVDLGSARDRLRMGAQGAPGEASAALLMEPLDTAWERAPSIYALEPEPPGARPGETVEVLRSIRLNWEIVVLQMDLLRPLLCDRSATWRGIGCCEWVVRGQVCLGFVFVVPARANVLQASKSSTGVRRIGCQVETVCDASTFFELGTGGFGSVFLAKVEHADGFSRLVAVKLLKNQWIDSKEIASRMRDEARLLGLLRHRKYR